MPVEQEGQFQTWIKGLPWYGEFVRNYGKEPNLNNPSYDYRAAWKAGIVPQVNPVDKRYHWDDAKDGRMMKSLQHPTAWMNFFMKEFGINPDSLPANDPRIVAYKQAWQKKYGSQLEGRQEGGFVEAGTPYMVGETAKSGSFGPPQTTPELAEIQEKFWKDTSKVLGTPFSSISAKPIGEFLASMIVPRTPEEAQAAAVTAIQPGLVKPKQLVEKLMGRGAITAYRGTEYSYPVIGKGTNFFATNPNYINKQFSTMEGFEQGMKVGKFKIDTKDFFNPFNPSDRAKLIDYIEKVSPESISNKALFDKNLASGNWLLLEDAMKYIKPNNKMGNVLEDLGYKGAFIVEDLDGKPYVNLMSFESKNIKPGW